MQCEINSQENRQPLQKCFIKIFCPVAVLFFFFSSRLRWVMLRLVMGPSPLSSRTQPPAPPLMHRLHQYLGTLVRAVLHLPTVRSRSPLCQVMTSERSRAEMICY